MNKPVVIRSSQGEFVCKADGTIPDGENRIYEDEDFTIEILKFDLDEWRTFHNDESLPNSIDILDLGYSWRNPHTGEQGFEPPAKDWRELMDSFDKREHLPITRGIVLDGKWFGKSGYDWFSDDGGVLKGTPEWFALQSIAMAREKSALSSPQSVLEEFYITTTCQNIESKKKRLREMEEDAQSGTILGDRARQMLSRCRFDLGTQKEHLEAEKKAAEILERNPDADRRGYLRISDLKSVEEIREAKAFLEPSFRFSPYACAKFNVLPEDYYDFLLDEAAQCADLADAGMGRVVDDLHEVREAIGVIPSSAEETHSYFNTRQIAILQTYLGGEFSHILKDRSPKKTCRKLPQDDRMLACMLAACDDESQSRDAAEISAMFDSAIAAAARVGKVVRCASADEAESASPGP
jgi:hypothetical protein